MTSKTIPAPAAILAKVDEIMSASRARYGHGAFVMRLDQEELPTDAELDRVRNGHFQDRNDRAKEAKRLQNKVWTVMQNIMRPVTNGERKELRASEARDYDKLEKVLDELGEIYDTNYVDRTGVVAPVENRVPSYRGEGVPLVGNQTMRGYVEATRAQLPNDVRNALENDGRGELDFGRYVQGAFTGNWDGAEAERVLNVQTGATDAAGGVQIPPILVADLIDAAQNEARVLRAGARVVPMGNRKVTQVRWLTDPQPEWRAENAPIAEDDATMDAIELNAHTLAVVTRATRELVEDTSIADQLKAAFVRSFALKLDWAALYGPGTGDLPTGVKSTTGVNVTPAAANGDTIDWDDLVDAVGRLRDVNEEPNAQIMSDKTARNLAKLKDGNLAYLAPPAYLDGVTRYSTNQVPNNLAVGTSGNTTSDVFTGDWSHLLWGVRTSLVISTLTERYMTRVVEDPETSPESDTGGQYGFVAWFRGDFAVARPKAFDVISGVKFA